MTGTKKHGYCGTPTYKSWSMMKARCDRPSYSRYGDYGGKGITYDPQWQQFENFLKDMGERPEGMTLDRFPNPSGDYCKENCRWATPQEQNNNKGLKTPLRGVSKIGKGWRARGRGNSGERPVVLYQGPDLQRAIEAREFYNSFILGEQ